MESLEKNNIQISPSELCALCLLKFGAFGKKMELDCNSNEIVGSGKNLAFCVRDPKFNVELNLVCNGEICGTITINSTKNISESEKQNSIFENLRPGFEAVCAKFSLHSCELSTEIKNFLQTKSRLNAPKISAFFTMADPLHRVHERLLRVMIDKADLVVIFLVGSAKNDAFAPNLRKKTLEFLCENFLVKERVLIVNLSDFKALQNHANPILECAIAYNLGINKVVLGQKHKHVSGYYDGNKMHTVLDFCRYDKFEIYLMPEYVYCNKCKSLVSVKNCPHGSHHHVHYHARNLKALLYAGILPPALFMRKEISAMILAELFRYRFSNLQDLYDDLFPNDGLIEPHDEREFYEQLMRLYQTSALKT